jgi:hypothetical protein
MTIESGNHGSHPELPDYSATKHPHPVPVVPREQQKPMLKIMSKILKMPKTRGLPKIGLPKRGLPNKHKVKFY